MDVGVQQAVAWPLPSVCLKTHAPASHGNAHQSAFHQSRARLGSPMALDGTVVKRAASVGPTWTQIHKLLFQSVCNCSGESDRSSPKLCLRQGTTNTVSTWGEPPRLFLRLFPGRHLPARPTTGSLRPALQARSRDRHPLLEGPRPDYSHARLAAPGSQPLRLKRALHTVPRPRLPWGPRTPHSP